MCNQSQTEIWNSRCCKVITLPKSMKCRIWQRIQNFQRRWITGFSGETNTRSYINMELWLFMFLRKHYDSFSCLLLFLFFSWFLSKLFKAKILNLNFCSLWNLREQVSSETFLLDFQFSTVVKTEVSCNYVTAWQHVISDSYNLVYCLSFTDTVLSLAYGIMDAIGFFAFCIKVGKKAGFIPWLPGSFEEQNISSSIPSFLFSSASVDKALHSPPTHRKWVLLIAGMILGG